MHSQPAATFARESPLLEASSRQQHLSQRHTYDCQVERRGEDEDEDEDEGLYLRGEIGSLHSFRLTPADYFYDAVGRRATFFRDSMRKSTQRDKQHYFQFPGPLFSIC